MIIFCRYIKNYVTQQKFWYIFKITINYKLRHSTSIKIQMIDIECRNLLNFELPNCSLRFERFFSKFTQFTWLTDRRTYIVISCQTNKEMDIILKIKHGSMVRFTFNIDFWYLCIKWLHVMKFLYVLYNY